jgi:hypothetical protein
MPEYVITEAVAPVPEPTPPAASTVVAPDGGPAPEYDHAAATSALMALVSGHGLFLQQLEIYSASQGGGQCLDDLSKAEMTDFYKHVRSALKDDAEGFVAMVKEI